MSKEGEGAKNALQNFGGPPLDRVIVEASPAYEQGFGVPQLDRLSAEDRKFIVDRLAEILIADFEAHVKEKQGVTSCTVVEGRRSNRRWLRCSALKFTGLQSQPDADICEAGEIHSQRQPPHP